MIMRSCAEERWQKVLTTNRLAPRVLSLQLNDMDFKFNGESGKNLLGRNLPISGGDPRVNRMVGE